MKKAIVLVAGIGLLTGIITSFSSCGEEKSTAPIISFATGTVYVSADTTLVHGSTFNIGINASKTGEEEFLTTCQIARSINGSPDSVIQSMNFIYQYFSQFYSYKAGDSGNVERYTFTVGEQGGLTASTSVTVTVN